jgi:hypothetical protein
VPPWSQAWGPARGAAWSLALLHRRDLHWSLWIPRTQLTATWCHFKSRTTFGIFHTAIGTQASTYLHPRVPTVFHYSLTSPARPAVQLWPQHAAILYYAILWRHVFNTAGACAQGTRRKAFIPKTWPASPSLTPSITTSAHHCRVWGHTFWGLCSPVPLLPPTLMYTTVGPEEAPVPGPYCQKYLTLQGPRTWVLWHIIRPRDVFLTVHNPALALLLPETPASSTARPCGDWGCVPCHCATTRSGLCHY